MRDIIDDVRKWEEEGKSIALATVIKTWGSAPRKVGSHMAVNADGEFTGSVSGGCIEGAVIAEALQAIKNQAAKLLHFGVSDDTAWDVGLACGGEIDVFVQPLDSAIANQISDLIEHDKAFSYAFEIDGKNADSGSFKVQTEVNNEEFPRIEDKKGAKQGQMFIDALLPSPVLIIVGGVDITIKLSQFANIMNFKTVIIDPRRAFGNENRFPEFDQLITAWPTEAVQSIELNSSTAVVTLTHDPKIDDPALLAALDSDVFYIGALGSKKTHQARRLRLKNEFGCTDEMLDRIKSPVGLDIGSQSPEEIALSIMAEILGVKNGFV